MDAQDPNANHSDGIPMDDEAAEDEQVLRYTCKEVIFEDPDDGPVLCGNLTVPGETYCYTCKNMQLKESMPTLVVSGGKQHVDPLPGPSSL